MFPTLRPGRSRHEVFKLVTPEIPELKLADSALWIWLPMLKMRGYMNQKDNAFQCWKDEYFSTDSSIDFNN